MDESMMPPGDGGDGLVGHPDPPTFNTSAVLRLVEEADRRSAAQVEALAGVLDEVVRGPLVASNVVDLTGDGPIRARLGAGAPTPARSASAVADHVRSAVMNADMVLEGVVDAELLYTVVSNAVLDAIEFADSHRVEGA
jgi:hypothetical protein